MISFASVVHFMLKKIQGYNFYTDFA